MCVVHFPDSTCESLQYLSDCKGPENRLQKLQDIARKRLLEPADSYKNKRMEDGYNRECYQRFTKNLNRLKGDDKTFQPSRSSRRSSENPERVIFKPDCIFCNKEGWKKKINKGVWTSGKTGFFDTDGWLSVVGAAEEKRDEKLLQRIRGQDLFACEARFHPRCCDKYMSNSWRKRWQKGDDTAKKCQNKIEESHKAVFAQVCQVVDNEILASAQMSQCHTNMYVLG